MPPVTQVERAFVWTLITQVAATCGGGPSVAFMLAAWDRVSRQLTAYLAAATRGPAPAGMQEEAAAVLRAMATSVDLLSDDQVCLAAMRLRAHVNAGCPQRGCACTRAGLCYPARERTHMLCVSSAVMPPFVQASHSVTGSARRYSSWQAACSMRSWPASWMPGCWGP